MIVSDLFQDMTLTQFWIREYKIKLVQQKLTSLDAGTEGISRWDMEELSEVVFVDVIRLLDTGLSITRFIPELQQERNGGHDQVGVHRVSTYFHI